jgi:hypothetical protein
MPWEAAASALVGVLLLGFVLLPLVRPWRGKVRATEPAEPEETRRGVALAALREIEFDRETGKISEGDYAALKTEYTAEAIVALRADAHEAIGADAGPACSDCGPRPEPDAAFCSSCGRRLETGRACVRCTAPIPPDGDYCEACGARAAA